MTSLQDRLKQVKKTRWIRFAVVSVIFFFWVYLMEWPWLLLIWPLLADIYITHYIPLHWWKKKKGPVRFIMSWVDALLYAFVLIYFIFTFIGQQYEIPSSSLEKSLLVGDRLWVDKSVYGARVPQTPLHFPLAQHTMPIIGTKSYIENPQLKYKRIKGLRNIERGDIVVFNYPQGDTVATLVPNPDYYQISHELRQKGIANPLEYIQANPQVYGRVVVRPVDRRENYVKRAIGLPGERIRIANDSIYIDGRLIPNPRNVQFNYIIPVNAPIAAERWLDLGVSPDDLADMPMASEGVYYYDLPLTPEMKAQVEKWPEVIAQPTPERYAGIFDLGGVFPLGAGYGWTRPNMGEIWIPKKGKTLHLTLRNLPIYERAIRTYEGNDLKVENGKIFINGKETDRYTFKMNYYWMMGDNRDRSADSRYWGFVPEDHVVGTPLFIIVSLDKDRSLFGGKIRFNRILGNPNPDKKTLKDA